jgi:hypothetical protein
MSLAALDLGTSQACAMKIPACICGTGKSWLAWCKTREVCWFGNSVQFRRLSFKRTSQPAQLKI